MIKSHKHHSILLLANKKSPALRKGDAVLDEHTIIDFLAVLPDWHLHEDRNIKRQYHFSNFQQTMHFVTEIGKIAEKNDHHPEVSFGFNYCSIIYSTHLINGLSVNDFICAAQIEIVFLNQHK